jgi:hypothetical protein
VSGAPVAGRLVDVGAHVRELIESDSEDAFLVIEVEGTDDFLQLLTVSGILRLDYPLLTARQRSLEPKLRSAAAALGLKVKGANDDDEFPVVDVDIPTSADAAEIVQRLLTELYGVTASTPLRFEHE